MLSPFKRWTICFVGVGSGGSQRNRSQVTFPYPFLGSFEDIYGPGFTQQDILNSIPPSRSLFGGGATSTQVGGQAQTGQATGGQPAAPGPRSYTLADIGGVVQTMNPKGAGKYIQKIADTLRQKGIDPNGPLTREQVLDAFRGGAQGQDAALAALFQQREESGNRQSPYAPATAPGGGGVDVEAGLKNLGFGQAAPQATVQTIRNAPTINAPTATAAQVQIPQGSLEEFQRANYEARFRPVERELSRQGTIQDRQLQAQLAQAGLQSSGAGLGQLQTQRNERQQRVFAAAQDAANQAATERFGVEFQSARENAQREQDTRLANAGFDYNAQVANADNILRGDSAKAENYLKTIGLNADMANAVRDDFLAELGLQEQDLARMDQAQRERITTTLNAWLQQFSALAQAGASTTGTGTGGSNVAVL